MAFLLVGHPNMLIFGEGKNEWKLITRPNVPVIFSQPVLKGVDDFINLGGLGDIELPMMVAPPLGNVIVGLGPIGQHMALKFLENYEKFPPLQTPPSFNLEEVMAQIRAQKQKIRTAGHPSD
jgi:hypothetical protein